MIKHDGAVNAALAAYYSKQQAKARSAAKAERDEREALEKAERAQAAALEKEQKATAEIANTQQQQAPIENTAQVKEQSNSACELVAA